MKFLLRNILHIWFGLILIFSLSGCGSGGVKSQDTLVGAEVPIIIVDDSYTFRGENTYNIEIKQGVPFNPHVTAKDNTGKDITSSIVVTGYVDTNVPGLYTQTYTVTDIAGNVSILIFNVTVQPFSTNTPPTITLLGANPLNVQQGSTFIDPGATANDKEDGDLTSKIKVSGTVDTSKAGTYTLLYTVTDSGGVVAKVTRIVHVTKTPTPPPSGNTPPTITLLGANPLNVQQGSAFTDPGATANDNEDGDLTSNIVKTGTVDTTTVGTYTLTYTVTDSGGLTATVTRTVNVKSTDTVPPVITLNTFNCQEINQTIEKGSSFTDVGATANDNIDGDISSNIVVTGTVDTNTVGAYTLKYNVSDAAGNAAIEKSRIIKVIESEVKKTDQTKSYDESGAVFVDDCSIKDDGFYQRGASRNFVRDDAKEIVTDKVTNLLWQDNNETTVHNKANATGAINFCNSMTLGGISNWRLPQTWELLTILDKTRYDPATDSVFQYNADTIYAQGYTWSATEVTPNSNTYWIVNFKTGVDVYDAGSASPYAVRCVSGPSTNYATTYTKDPSTKIVSSSVTGLEWADDDLTGATAKNLTWKSAIDFCENLDAEGYGDWRLPNINEYYSIFNYEKNEINPVKFNLTTGSVKMWSSTTSALNGADHAWVMKQQGGDSTPVLKTDAHNFMCVRNK